MPVAIELGPISTHSREFFGLPVGRFLFFFAFDFMSFVQRKNPRAAVRAFRMAFPLRGQAVLVLKCINGDHAPEQRTTLMAELDGDPDIIVIEKTLSRADTLGLISACDAILSLHRSEGLGLLIAEGMLLGKPVIATGYSASREFLTDQTGYPVEFDLVAVNEGDYPFFAGQLWAEPDVAHAAWLMRGLYKDPGKAGPLCARALDHLHQNYGRRRVAAMQKHRLQVLGMA
jgi:glycosyltransferase involved in cell wall biosynthesis